ncbi:hypothetical protein CGMCC3_g7926 [Colletotrichum fructicola]|nr:uncharacterized protein CGMCC3_g7926 [Colletotrichum fructicola]KAE9576272.1 hypothetical protein CGMCC3_g7926 [Colletotrichum fructicola]
MLKLLSMRFAAQTRQTAIWQHGILGFVRRRLVRMSASYHAPIRFPGSRTSVRPAWGAANR